MVYTFTPNHLKDLPIFTSNARLPQRFHPQLIRSIPAGYWSIHVFHLLVVLSIFYKQQHRQVRFKNNRNICMIIVSLYVYTFTVSSSQFDHEGD